MSSKAEKPFPAVIGRERDLTGSAAMRNVDIGVILHKTYGEGTVAIMYL